MKQNVGSLERGISLALGAGLAAWGLTRRSAAGRLVALSGGALAFRGASGFCPLYQAAGLSSSDDGRGAQTTVPYGRGVRVERSTTINRSPEELYRFWRQLENLPRIFSHLESVQVTSGNRSHWTGRGTGAPVEWDAEIINDIPNELIGWRSLEGSDIQHAGSVHFEKAPGGRGTVLKVILRYDPPGGRVAAGIAKLLGEEPAAAVSDDLRRLKQSMETGEIPTIDGQPAGR
jgi:uncharacterized membrane protein